MYATAVCGTEQTEVVGLEPPADGAEISDDRPASAVNAGGLREAAAHHALGPVSKRIDRDLRRGADRLPAEGIVSDDRRSHQRTCIVIRQQGVTIADPS